MLKYETFSDFFRNKKLEAIDNLNNSHEINGTLAVSYKHKKKPMPIGRKTSRTWWEDGWKLK